jgi:hypothetical protein
VDAYAVNQDLDQEFTAERPSHDKLEKLVSMKVGMPASLHCRQLQQLPHMCAASACNCTGDPQLTTLSRVQAPDYLLACAGLHQVPRCTSGGAVVAEPGEHFARGGR